MIDSTYEKNKFEVIIAHLSSLKLNILAAITVNQIKVLKSLIHHALTRNKLIISFVFPKVLMYRIVPDIKLQLHIDSPVREI